MAFRDLQDVYLPTPKVLPIHGEEIEFPGRISADAGMTMLAIRSAMLEQVGTEGTEEEYASAALTEVTAGQVAALEAEILGDAAADLDRLGVFGAARQHVVSTLVAWHMAGEEVAVATWEGKARPAPPTTSARRAGSARRTAGGAGGRSMAAAQKATAARSATARSGRRTQQGKG